MNDVRRLADRELSVEEARAYREAPITAQERDEVLALARWFTRRYDTPAARLAYVRRAYERWRRTAGIAQRLPDNDSVIR